MMGDYEKGEALLKESLAINRSKADSLEKYMGLMEKAIATGYPPALYALGAELVIASSTAKQGQELIARAAEAGNPEAQYSMGISYSYAMDGHPQDYKAALQWLVKAADAGHAQAQVALGGMYKDGRGVEQDYDAARAWYQKAADAGNGNGRYYLEELIENVDRWRAEVQAARDEDTRLAARTPEEIKRDDEAASIKVEEAARAKAAAGAELATALQPLYRRASILSIKKTRPPAKAETLSHFGGKPYFEEGWEWPCLDDGEPAEFRFQIFQDDEGSIALPKGVKLLQCFAGPDWEPRILLHKTLTAQSGKALSIAAPKDPITYPYCSVAFRNVLMLPDPVDLPAISPEIAALAERYMPGVTEYSYSLYNGLDICDERNAFSYLGGYPYWILQGSGGFKYNEHLFQLAEEEDAKIFWADGVVNVFRNPETGETGLHRQYPD
jgi:hypothetical protein